MITRVHAQYVCLLGWLQEEREKRQVSADEEYRFAAELWALWEQLTPAEQADVEARLKA
jgi:hypothetical protein